jgi:hypothetical protein
MLRSPRERQPAELSEQESTEDAERRTAENVHPEHRLAGRCVRAEDSSDHERLDKSEVGVQEASRHGRADEVLQPGNRCARSADCWERELSTATE